MNPIILFHGALGARQQLEPLKKLLIETGREVYSLNFSGHAGLPYSSAGFGIEAFSEDVLTFLQENKISKVDIFGYSMGGYVALWLAYLNPELVENIFTLGTKFDWSVTSASKEIGKMNPDKIVEKVPAFARILEHRHAPNGWKELMIKTADMMASLGNHPLLTEIEFRQIKQNVKIILGDADDMADKNFSEQVAAWLPKGKFIPIKNTPHPIEKVDLNELIGFLK